MPTFSAMSRFMTTQTVGMPSVSIARAISPTDCWQIGQHGVRKAACTPSAASRRATWGAVL
jgi:hypothetical protein